MNKENKQRTAAIFLDIEKAFDRVWHPGLLYKLYQLNTPAYLLALIKSFLEDRSFIVRVDNETSSAKPIRAGVPQGSCLSPLLYSAYTNDIPLNSNATLSLFADDTLLTTTNRNPSRAAIQLQKQIDIAMAWFQKWKLKVNAQKSVAVMFNRPRGYTDFKPQINGQIIEWSHSSKYLGLTIDQDLKFKDHIKNVTKRATAIRGMLYPVLNHRSPIPIKTKIICLQLYIGSVLSYAGPAWAPLLSRSSWRKVESVQNIGLRTITASPWFVNNVTIRKSSRVVSIEEKIKRNSKTLFHKNLTSPHPHIRDLGRTRANPLLTKNNTRHLDWAHS